MIVLWSVPACRFEEYITFIQCCDFRTSFYYSAALKTQHESLKKIVVEKAEEEGKQLEVEDEWEEREG